MSTIIILQCPAVEVQWIGLICTAARESDIVHQTPGQAKGPSPQGFHDDGRACRTLATEQAWSRGAPPGRLQYDAIPSLGTSSLIRPAICACIGGTTSTARGIVLLFVGEAAGGGQSSPAAPTVRIWLGGCLELYRGRQSSEQ